MSIESEVFRKAVEQKINKDLNTDKLSDSVLDAYENAVRGFAGDGLTGASERDVIEFDKERFYKLVIVLAYFAGFFVGAIIKQK